MNYYNRHIGDYLKDTSHLSLLEHGIYTRLLDVYYTREAPIPDDQAARLIGAKSKEEKEALAGVLSEFFAINNGAWEQTRCQREIDLCSEKSNKAKASAEARWKKDKPQSERNADAMRTHTERNADAMLPITNNQEPIAKDKEDATHLLSEAELPPALPTCPHRVLIDLYHAKLPTLPRVRAELWDGSKAEHLRARWRWVMTAKRDNGQRYATSETEALAWFGKFFDAVSQSDFLTGRSGQWSACNFAWLVKADNFAKVVQGNYENRSTR
jgi:uncharacterized protein YdaU (DUF1376 family)